MSEEIERLEKLVRDGFTVVLAKLEDVETEIRSLRGEVPDEPEPDPIREPEPEPVDPDTYVFDTNNLPEVWTHKPSNGSDVLQLQSGVEMPAVPQRPVDSYSLQLWLRGHPVEKRNVLAWMVAGIGPLSP